MKLHLIFIANIAPETKAGSGLGCREVQQVWTGGSASGAMVARKVLEGSVWAVGTKEQ